MKNDIHKIREQLIDKLDKLVQSTEKIYLNLGRNYPLLLTELDTSIIKSSSSIEILKSTHNGPFDEIDLIISEGDRIIDNFDEVFTSMYSRDGELFKIIRRGVTEMGTLSEVINNIKEGSIEMELISLNAMTVALKSGSTGKALSFITDELKKLSAQTIRLTDELNQNGKHQLKLFEDFGKKIEETRKKQNELTENLDRHLKSSFTTSSKGLQESADMMLSLSKSSADVKEPLTRIMQEIQLQDIIRQSIDHIYISVDEFKTINDNWTAEERLDELSFRKVMPDLCLTVLKDVKNEIDESSHIFDEKSQLVKSILDTLEQKRIDFIESALNRSSNNNFSIIALKEESQKKINSLINEVNLSMKSRSAISQEGLNILKKIRILRRQFESFEPIITRFHNIIVASRIEVAKQAALSDMKDTVIQMTQLTEDINTDISNALETIKHFLKTTEGIISSYSSTIAREMPGLKQLLIRTSDNQERLNSVTNALIDSLKVFQIFTARFFKLFKETDANRLELNQLSENIGEIEAILQLIKSNANSDIFDIQGNSNIDNWTIQNKRLNGIIDKFTIFTHKKTASDLVGNTVHTEKTAESGEITLF